MKLSNSRGAGLLAKALKLRNRHFFIADLLFLAIAPTLALIIRIDAYPDLDRYFLTLLVFSAMGLVVRPLIFAQHGLYQRYWRYASIAEGVQISVAVILSSAILLALYWLARAVHGLVEPDIVLTTFPRSLPLIEMLLVIFFVTTVRFSMRLADWSHQLNHQHRPEGSTTRALIVGAGSAGSMIAREITRNPHLGIEVVGLVDDDPAKQRMAMNGLTVLGDRHDIPYLARIHRVDQAVIAMPTANGKAIREITSICQHAGIEARTVPGMYELIGGLIDYSQIRPVQIEDLLRRDPVEIDIKAVHHALRGRRVLVTGGGGSIGSELCRQILRAAPAELILLGHGENSVFEIEQELQGGHNGGVVVRAVIADIRFAARIETLFAELRPDTIFHAAAHKHVPLMERNPAEAITNNVLGTRNVVQAALAAGVENLVMISTDKAVNPSSIMGASKRAAEMVVLNAAQQQGKNYVAVRFGNVLGSRGSVLHPFNRQIAAGGPVTVTDPRIRRYFMTIPEAVQLVLQASVLGQGGEIFTLDMGEPVLIADIAADLIHLSGFKVGREVEIEYVGLRPGEKLFEELFLSDETYCPTRHEKIFIASNAADLVPENLSGDINALQAVAERGQWDQIVTQLQALIPEYEPVSSPSLDGSGQKPNQAGARNESARAYDTHENPELAPIRLATARS